MKKFCILIALLLLAGCTTNNKKEMEMLSYQLNVEQQQRLAMEKKINELEEKLGQTDTSLREEISQSNQPVRFNQANISEEVRSLRTQLAKVQGELEEVNKRAELQEQASANKTKEIQRLTAREKQLTQKLQQISSQLGVEQTDMQSGAAKSSKQTASAAIAPVPTKEKQYTSAQALYKKALEAFYARKYAQAQNMWGEFTTSFPNNQLTPNAYFWHGEAAYQQQNYAQAVLSYQQVISKYKKSNKYAPALLKQGISFFKLGKKEAGTIVLNDLIKQLPESFEATQAKTFLKNPK